MTNREEANKLASKIKGETVNADTTKKALEAIGGKSAGSMAEALENIVQGDIPSGGGKPEQTKSVTITENGTTTVTPDAGKTLSSVGITVNVASGTVYPTAGGEAYSVSEDPNESTSATTWALLLVFGQLWGTPTGKYCFLVQTSGGNPMWWEEAVWGDVADLNFQSGSSGSAKGSVEINGQTLYLYNCGFN